LNVILILFQTDVTLNVANLTHDIAARASVGAVTAPTYVLEESMSSQNLWKDTAGTRPPQPVEERAFFERIWTQNFARSQVSYSQPVEVLTATSPISLSPFADGNMVDGVSRGIRATDAYNMESSAHAGAGDVLIDYSHLGHGLQHHRVSSRGSLGPHHHHHTLVHKKVKGEMKEDLTVLVRGDNVFGTTVSKSFMKNSKAVTVSISIASYRVVEVRLLIKFDDVNRCCSILILLSNQYGWTFIVETSW